MAISENLKRRLNAAKAGGSVSSGNDVAMSMKKDTSSASNNIYDRLASARAKVQSSKNTDAITAPTSNIYGNPARKAGRAANRNSVTQDNTGKSYENLVNASAFQNDEDELVSRAARDPQSVINDFANMGAARTAYDKGIRTESDQNFGDRVGNIATGSAKSYLGDIWSGIGTNVEAIGGTYVTDVYQQQVDSEQQRLEALKANKEKYYATMTEEERADIDDEIALAQQQLQMNEKAVYANKSSGKAARDASAELTASGAADIQKAKEGLSPIEQNLIDVGVGGTQLAADIGLGATTGAGLMAVMAARSYGGATETARQSGASIDKQIAYGVGTAGLTYATERLSNIALAGLKLVKPGVTDNVVKGAINKLSSKLASSASGRAAVNTVLNLGASGVGEGTEEFIQDALDPYLKRLTYDPDADTIFSSPELLSNALYDFLIGAELGLVMQGANVANNAINGGKQDTSPVAENVGMSPGLEESSPKVNPAQETDTLSTILEAAKENGTVSNSAAEKILDDSTALDMLKSNAGLNIQSGMTSSQKRAAVKAAISTLASRAETATPAQATNYTTQTQAAQGANVEAERTSTAEVEHRVRQVAKVSSAFGSGAEFVESMYDPKTQDSVSYLEDMLAYYNAGAEGKTVASVTPKNGIVTQTQMKAAYFAGQADAANAANTKKQTESEGMNNGTGNAGSGRDGERTYNLVAGEPGGSVEARTSQAESGRPGGDQAERAAKIRNSVKAEREVSTAGQGISIGTTNNTLRVVKWDYWTPEMRTTYRTQEKAGRQIIYFTGSLEMRDASGTFTARGAVSPDGKRMWVRADHDTLTVEQITKHEEFHAKVKADGALLESVRESIISGHSDAKLEAMADAYAELYFTDTEGNVTVDKDYILEEIFADAYAGIDVFEGAVDGEMGADKFFNEAWGGVISRDNAAATDRTTGPPDGERFSIEPEFAREIDAWDGKADKTFRVGTTSEALQSIGVEDRGIIWRGRKISEILRKHRGMTRSIIKQVPNILENPVAVLKSQNSDSRLAIFGTVKDENGAPVMVILELQPTNRGAELLDMNVIASVYGKNSNPTQFIKNSDLLYLDPDKNRTKSWMQGLGLQLPSDANAFGSMGTISYQDGKVKIEGVSYDQFMQGSAENTQEKLSRDVQSLDELREQNDDLRERVEYLKTQIKRTEQKALRKGDIDKLANNIVKDYFSETKADSISGRLKALGEYIVNNGDGKNELTYSEVKTKAIDIARDVVQNASELVNSEELRVYKDIRSYLRKTKLAFNDKSDIADYNDFRKHNFGRFTISQDGLPVDTAYQEMSKTFGEAYFPSDITNPADQLMHIADLMAGMEPIYENPYSYNMAEATEYCANGIIDGLVGDDVRQTAPTFADKQASKLEAQTAKGRQQLEGLREQKNQRIAEIKEQGRERVKQAVEREQTRRTKQVTALKDHYRETAKSRQYHAADSRARSRLLSIAKRLQNKKLPAVNRALLNQYIGEIDTVSKSIMGKTVDKLTELQTWYEDQRDNNPDFITEPSIEKALQRLSKKQVSELSNSEVAELTNILLNIENEIRTHKKLIDSEEKRDVYNMGVQVIEDVDNTGGSKEGGLVGTLDKYVVTETLSPVRQVRRMTGYVDSDPLYVLTNELANGQRTMFDYQRRANELFKRYTEDKAFVGAIAGDKAKTIDITGIGHNGPTTVSITPAMRMSLYLHSLNDQNLKHIAGGGITVPDATLYKKGKIAEAYARGKTIKLTPSQVRHIADGMSTKERAFALKAHDYFNGMSRDEINAVSEKLKGFSLAQVDDYFPINTDTSFTKSDFEAIKFDGTIEGMGFLKERINAANPIMLRDMNSVLTQNINQNAKYAGLAIPIRNFNKMWGVTKSSFSENGERNNFESSVQQIVKNKWGEDGYDYIEKMMVDLNGAQKKPGKWSKALSKVRSNYAGAVLTLNASVAMKQAASYPTAGAVIGFKPLARAMADFGKVDLDLIARYTPLQWYRSQGFSTQELGDMAKRGKSLPKLLNWVQGVDVITTRKLWKAAEYYVRQTDKSLSIGTDPYYRAIANVYNRIIEETQPNYTTMQRPQLLRSDDTLMQNLAMFKTQPFQNFNILYDSIGNLEAKKRAYINTGTAESKTAYEKAKTNVAWAATSQVMQLAVFAGMTFAWNMFRDKKDKYDDDEGEMTIQSALGGIGKDMIGGAAAIVPFGSDVWALASSKLFGDRYYGFDAVTASAINDMANALGSGANSIGEIWNAVKDPDASVDWNEQRLKFDSVFDAISKIIGIPYENISNLFNATFQRASVAASGEYLGRYTAMKLTTSPASYPADYYDLLYKAYANDRDAYEKIYADMIEGGSFTSEKIKDAMESHMKAAVGVKSVDDLSKRFLSPEQETQYDGIFDGISETRNYKRATEDQRDSLDDLIYQYVTGTLSDSQTEKIESATDYGISTESYMLYRLALEMQDQPEGQKGHGNYSQGEAELALKSVSGLSMREREYLWQLANSAWSKDNNPFG